MSKPWFGICFVLALSTAAHAEQYICVADKVVGFLYDKDTKEWLGSNFTVDGKYVIKQTADGVNAYTVTKMGESWTELLCKEGFNQYGYLFCEQLATTFRFNKRSGRYIRGSLGGYYNVIPGSDDTEVTSDTPFIEIGKCSPF